MASEPVVSYYVTTRCHKPEDHDLNFHRHEDLKSRIRLGEINVQYFVFKFDFISLFPHVLDDCASTSML
jgi:hypothetical protein